MNKILTYPKRLLFSNATHLVLYKREFKFSNHRNRWTAWTVASPSTPREHWNSMHGAQRRLPSRIKQESRNSRRKRVLSASRIKFKDKRSQGTLVFSSPRRRHPPAAPRRAAPSRFFHALPFLLQIQFSVASLHHPLLHPPPTYRASRSALFETLREITLNIYFRDDCSRRYDGINIIM